jgi:hypothetical protein
VNPHIQVDNRITSSITLTNNKLTTGNVTKLDNATQGKFTSKQRIPSSVDDPRHAYYPTGTDWETFLVRIGIVESPHDHPQSLLHNLTKLIAKDKAVSTFWDCARKPSRRKVFDMQFGCSKERLYSSLLYTIIFSLVDIAFPMTSLYLCWKTFLKSDFCKLSREGGTHLFSIRIHGQSHITNSQLLCSTLQVLWPFSCHGSTLQVLRLAPFSIFLKTFYKTQTDIGLDSNHSNRPWLRTRLFE